MNLNRLIIVSLVLTSNRCLAEIFKLTSVSKELTTLAETTVEILTSCYDLDVNTVGLAGILESTLFETLWTKWSLSVTLIGDIDEDVEGPPVDRISRYKLQTFVVTASSLKQLQQSLNQTKSSQWWNHMATFFIVDWQTSGEHECSNAFEFLWAAWQMNLLNAFYVCFRHPDKRLIYNYNPFTPQAPVSWQPVKTYTAETGHPWTLFVREYKVGLGVCEQWDFDKTKDLGGYVIRAGTADLGELWVTDRNKTGVDSFGGMLGRYSQIIFRTLNATPHLMLNGWFSLTTDIANGITDVMLLTMYDRRTKNLTYSYWVGQSGLAIVTQYRGYVSEMSKIIHVIDTSSRFGMFVVVMSTIIFFKYCLGHPFGLATINSIRMLFNSTLTKLPENSAARIYLTCVSFVFITVAAIYQGKMASLLTKSESLRNVQSMSDLADLGYTIHAEDQFEMFFSDPMFEGRFEGHTYGDCIAHVLHNSSAACVWDRYLLVSGVVKFKLHMSDDNVANAFIVYVLREDWPLERRFNAILATLFESNISHRVLFHWFSKIAIVNDFLTNLDEATKFRIINLSEMRFAFVILAYGLGCATVSFIFEMGVK